MPKRLMTPRGHKRIKKELEDFKSQRPALADLIEEARSHGDLSENADYDAAKNKSGLVEAKIRVLEASLSDFEIVNPLELKNITKVVFGTTVKVEDVDNGEEKVFSIYGDEESDPDNGWLSYNTPLAKALFGKEVGDIATLKLPGKTREYEVLEIRVDYTEE